MVIGGMVNVMEGVHTALMHQSPEWRRWRFSIGVCFFHFSHIEGNNGLSEFLPYAWIYFSAFPRHQSWSYLLDPKSSIVPFLARSPRLLLAPKYLRMASHGSGASIGASSVSELRDLYWWLLWKEYSRCHSWCAFLKTFISGMVK